MAIDRTLVLIRERSLVDILDLALIVIRDRPWTLGLAAALGIVPFAVLNAWLFQMIEEPSGFIFCTSWILEAPLATAPLTLVLGGLMFGHPFRLVATLRTLIGRSVSIILADGVIRFFLCFLIPSHLAFSNEMILLERTRWWKLFQRGGNLCGHRGGELFALALLQLVVIIGFALTFYIGSGRAIDAVIGSESSWHLPDGPESLAHWRFQLPIWLGVAYFAVVRFLVYIDQRIRLEGWEVELRLRAVAESMREGERW